MTTDLTFITNEENRNLLKRFRVLIKDTRFFDCLVGYFYSSGFYRLYPSQETTEKIRILIEISTDKPTFQVIQQARQSSQLPLFFSHTEVSQSPDDLPKLYASVKQAKDLVENILPEAIKALSILFQYYGPFLKGFHIHSDDLSSLGHLNADTEKAEHLFRYLKFHGDLSTYSPVMAPVKSRLDWIKEHESS